MLIVFIEWRVSKREDGVLDACALKPNEANGCDRKPTSIFGSMPKSRFFCKFKRTGWWA